MARARPFLSPIALVLLAALIAPAPTFGAATPGALDTSFNGTGQRRTAFGVDAEANAVAMQGRKIVAVGGRQKTFAGPLDFGVVRYRAGGKLDRTFGRRGKAKVDFGGSDVAEDVAILPNGKVLVVGSSQNASGRDRFAIARLTAEGKLDRSFGGGDGKVLTVFGPGESVGEAVVLLGGGRFAVAGSHELPGGEVRFAVARYRADGRLDRSFGGDGKVLTGFLAGPEDSRVTDLLRYGDDWLVAVGTTDGSGPGNAYDLALARYRSNGSRDPLFGGGDGKVVADLADFELAYAAVLQRNNFILVLANSVVGDWAATFVRFNASGNVDVAWGGGDGMVSHDLGADEWWYDVVRAGRKAIAVGEVGNDAAALRILGNGNLDPVFGTGGVSVTPFPGGDSWLYGVTLQGDGRIVGVGTAPATLTADGFAVERLLA